MNLVFSTSPITPEGSTIVTHVANTLAIDRFILAPLCILFFLQGSLAFTWQIWRLNNHPELHVKLFMALAIRHENDFLLPVKHDPPATFEDYQGKKS